MAAAQPPVEVEFFLDPVCPWCWLTSRWVTHVQEQKRYTVGWRFISLEILNEDKERSPEYQAVHQAGLRALRVADQVRLDHGNDAVAAYYTALGTKIHVERRREELVGDTVALVAEALSEAGLPKELTEHLDDDRHDAYLRRRPSWPSRVPGPTSARRSSRSLPGRASGRAASSDR